MCLSTRDLRRAIDTLDIGSGRFDAANLGFQIQFFHGSYTECRVVCDGCFMLWVYLRGSNCCLELIFVFVEGAAPWSSLCSEYEDSLGSLNAKEAAGGHCHNEHWTQRPKPGDSTFCRDSLPSRHVLVPPQHA